MFFENKHSEKENEDTLEIPNLNPDIWGTHYWFFLHTIAFYYPDPPNDITKRKYYDLIHNFPLFIPDAKIGDKFASLLDKYPLSPYLCSRESFLRWVFFIHNKINNHLGKRELTYFDAVNAYKDQYMPRPVHINKSIGVNQKNIVIGIIFFSVAFSLFYMTIPNNTIAFNYSSIFRKQM